MTAYAYPFRCLACGAWYVAHVGWCSSCFSSSTILQVGRRTRALLDSIPERTTAKSLLRATWQVVETTGFPALALCRGALVVCVGPPGGGKSSWVCRALDGVRGPVVYVSCEEAPGPTVASRLLRMGVKREDFAVVGRASVDQVVAVAVETKARALAIDSANVAAFTARDLRHLLVCLPSVELVIASAQVNGRGELAGRRELEHEADVVVACEELVWSLTKSRYQKIEGVGGPVLRQEATTNAA